MSKSKTIKILVGIIIILMIITVVIFILYILKNKDEIYKIQNSNKYKENSKINNEIIENCEMKKKLLIYDIDEGYLTVPYNFKAKTHNYNFEQKLKLNNGYYKYKDDNYESTLGIDVSEYQGDIDWNKVKDSGVKFAILRLGYRGYGQEGKIILDSKFIENYENAKNEGIKLGVYFFSQALNLEELREETNFILENIKNKDIELPVVFDLEKIKNDEGRTDNLSPDEINSMTLEFCKIIKSCGYIPAIYGNAKTFTTMMKLEEFNDYIKWYADYQEKPLYPYSFSFWQYSESGKVDGIEGNVDIDLYFRRINIKNE